MSIREREREIGGGRPIAAQIDSILDRLELLQNQTTEKNPTNNDDDDDNKKPARI